MSHKNWTPFITIRAVQPMVAAYQALGYDAEQMLKKCKISPDVLVDADGRLPHTAMATFWEQALEISGDPNMGLHLAGAAPLDSFGVHAYAVQSSPNLREAFRRASRYQRLIHEVNSLIFSEGEEEGVLQHALPDGRSVSRHPAEFLVALWVRFGRLIIGSEWSPRLVCFAHEQPPDTIQHQRIFRTALQFHSGRTAIHIPNADLDQPNAGADLGLVRVLDDYAARLLERLPSEATLSERVRFQLQEALAGGGSPPTAEETAQALHMSARTLHRNLRAEGATFSGLLNQLRREQAVQYLENPRISITEAAFLLGFSELSSFYRAFKRWTGVTPAEFREGRYYEC